MSIRADIAAPEPTVIRAIVVKTKVLNCIDCALTAAGEDDDWVRCPRVLGMRVDTMFTGLAQRLVDVSGEGLGFFRALVSGFIGFNGLWRWHPERSGPRDMDKEANPHESGQ